LPELGGKQLQVLQEAFPGLARVAILWNPTNPANQISVRAMQGAAEALGLQVHSLEVREASQFEGAFATATRESVQALITTREPLFNGHMSQIIDFAAQSRLPVLYPRREFVDAGGLMAYGADNKELERRAAAYVDKLLRGAKPADLPVERPTKFELVINLKTAQALGITFPPRLLFQADEVIK
jgi:putative ABC transport system substrate-binding protein